jgi:hypothetical protein
MKPPRAKQATAQAQPKANASLYVPLPRFSLRIEQNSNDLNTFSTRRRSEYIASIHQPSISIFVDRFSHRPIPGNGNY